MTEDRRWRGKGTFSHLILLLTDEHTNAELEMDDDDTTKVRWNDQQSHSNRKQFRMAHLNGADVDRYPCKMKSFIRHSTIRSVACTMRRTKLFEYAIDGSDHCGSLATSSCPRYVGFSFCASRSSSPSPSLRLLDRQHERSFTMNIVTAIT